jgi:hypothetical protein
MISKVDDEAIPFDRREPFRDPISQIVEPVVAQYSKIAKSYFFFHIAFTLGIALEILLIVFFFSTLTQSSILALSFAALFFTVFAFFTMRIYLQAKKDEQLKELKDRYVSACKSLINYREGNSESHHSIANGACRLAAQIENLESQFYDFPNLFSLSQILAKYSRRFHWRDFLNFREMLLRAAVEEHIKIVKCEPTNMEAHANLANAYVLLSGLYGEHRKRAASEDESLKISREFSDELEKKFRFTAERAIEELKILNEYAPNDPWIHAQLAYSYHDLQMPLEEMQEYETILKLRPEDKETQLKLGILYFEQGLNAKGLRVYEELKRNNYKKAETLINHYGSYQIG